MSSDERVPLTAVVIAKNEAAAIERCIEALGFCDQVLVVDSQSNDATVAKARQLGAEVIDFTWNGTYPKKKQWGMEHELVRHNWVLHLDADEVVTPQLAEEIARLISTADSAGIVAAELPLSYYFTGKELRFGHRVVKRSLLDRRHCRFPEVGDLAAPGITEVEGHYQPHCDGVVTRTSARLSHHDPDPIGTWITRHNRYADWEAYLRVNPAIESVVREARSNQGRLFSRLPCKPFFFFLYSYIARGGFRDGRAGFNYAFGLTWYYWLTEVKVEELLRLRPPDYSSSQAFEDATKTSSRRL